MRPINFIFIIWTVIAIGLAHIQSERGEKENAKKKEKELLKNKYTNKFSSYTYLRLNTISFRTVPFNSYKNLITHTLLNIHFVHTTTELYPRSFHIILQWDSTYSLGVCRESRVRRAERLTSCRHVQPPASWPSDQLLHGHTLRCWFYPCPRRLRGDRSSVVSYTLCFVSLETRFVVKAYRGHITGIRVYSKSPFARAALAVCLVARCFEKAVFGNRWR